MKIFIDSADIDQINEAITWGIVDGITTNPSLIKKAFQKHSGTDLAPSMRDYVQRICEAAGDRPVSLEVIGPGEDAMVTQGRFLFETFNPVADNVVVKIPVNPNLDLGGATGYDGLKAIYTLSFQGIPINTTLVFSPEQALLAAKAGADYVSPFAGRIDDMLRKDQSLQFGKLDHFPAEGLRDADGQLQTHDSGIRSGVHLVQSIVRIFEIHEMDCQVLAASLRNPRQVRECADVGAEICTIPFQVIRDMVEHKKTVEGMKAFMDDVVPEYRDLLPGD